MIRLPKVIFWRRMALYRVKTNIVLWKSEGVAVQHDLGGITARVKKLRAKEKPYEALVCIDGRGYMNRGDTPEEALEGSLALRIGRVEDWLRRVKLWVEETK